MAKNTWIKTWNSKQVNKLRGARPDLSWIPVKSEVRKKNPSLTIQPDTQSLWVILLVFKTFQPSIEFYIETSLLICTANQITGSYIYCNNELKWVNPVRLSENHLTRFFMTGSIKIYIFLCYVPFWSPWEYSENQRWRLKGKVRKKWVWVNSNHNHTFWFFHRVQKSPME